MTAPYDAKTWDALCACGGAVEASLARSGVVLTMGGEPTFVPFGCQGAEWFTAALGPTKLGYARRFARELLRKVFPGGAVLETSGKLYPGEVLPRWALLVQRRADGVPLWRDPERLCGDLAPGGHALADARAAVTALATALGLDPRMALECTEGGPVGAALSGYVLPLDRAGDRWTSDDWRTAFPTGLVPILPGDSMLGLRLPLGTLGEGNLRRALTVELRDGSLSFFVPPLLLEGYVALLAAIEKMLEDRELKGVVLGGYPPPRDPALPTLGLASDPGVLEVNLVPCATWADYDRQLEQLYATAASVGMTGGKLALNGRQTGTGGGAHIVFGGPSPMESPFFLSPALLPSIVRYWQHHPGLSYAFTGNYMGPSSQAPRIDESTFEALYELEIACEGAERFGKPWNLALFDLLFRDLLMDRTGNAHRAEISVDKLWNAFSPGGQLGLIEFRAFESHPQRAALSATGLLVRAILARLAARPFREPFIRWGGALHDRFFLPAFARADLAAVAADLAAHDIPFDPAWLDPLLDWRFPVIGRLSVPSTAPAARPLDIEFRQALEAWPLLGEQPAGTGTSRSVDASNDRLQAFAADPAALEKGLLLVNGLPCPFRPAPGGGAAAGIRFRAFFLNPALQPHVPVHSPLLIEWVDRATLSVAAAARWHVWNPREHAYTDRPADAAAAQARQAERWQPWTQTLGQPRIIPEVVLPPEGQHTLDLRRYGR